MQKSAYLVAQYYAKPRRPGQTFQSGYMKDESNISWDETVNITLGLKDKDLTSSVILDINNRKVVKNNFNNGKEFDELFDYYFNAQPQEITQALARVGISIAKEEPKEEVVSAEVA
jgi:hypothetical protein